VHDQEKPDKAYELYFSLKRDAHAALNRS
jgi:hypothetical protein